MKEEKIDFVIAWVDGNDPAWRKEKEKYSPDKNSDSSIYRYRDWDLLRYWFRGVEKYAPWVNKIYFITWGHLPEWLNVDNEKLVIVNHKDFIPNEYLPTFNSRVIDCNLHRIKNLNENFVYFNDDFYLIKEVKETDFFKNGKPMDTIALNANCPKKKNLGHYVAFTDTAVINEHFNFKKSFFGNFTKWFNPKNGKNILRTLALFNCPRFPGFYQHHLPTSFKKQTFYKLWDVEEEFLKETCMDKFRTITDVNQWVFKNWQIAEGNIEIRSNKSGKAFYIDRDGLDTIGNETLNYISKQKGKMIALNDGPMEEEKFEKFKLELKKSFESILPDESSFEKE